ncbi:MAG: lipid-A-disaccharide synthase, partial [Sphingobacteriales bacterium]
GGEQMQEQGGELVVHYRELAFMGFIEVLASIFKITALLKRCREDIADYKPDVVILVDYAGFNMRIAKYCKTHGIRTFFYISPKIWAWNEGRVKGVKQNIDRMFTILPFETDFYKKHDYTVDYVGNPIADTVAEHQINPHFREQNKLGDKPIIAILPGSRKQEIESMLHFMVSIVPSFPDHILVIAAVSNLDAKYYEAFRRHDRVKIVYDQSYDLLAHSEAALVTSGTATLETALFNVPQVVCYKGSMASYLIARAVIKVKYISLVNLVAERAVVPELIQENFKPSYLITELRKILFDKEARQAQLDGYAEIRKKLGQHQAAKKAAELMVGYLKRSA